jgi:hypothetical protein
MSTGNVQNHWDKVNEHPLSAVNQIIVLTSFYFKAFIHNHTFTQNVVVESLTLLLRIRQIPGSNLGSGKRLS